MAARNRHKRWTEEETVRLYKLLKSGLSTKEAGRELGRSTHAVRSRINIINAVEQIKSDESVKLSKSRVALFISIVSLSISLLVLILRILT